MLRFLALLSTSVLVIAGCSSEHGRGGGPGSAAVAGQGSAAKPAGSAQPGSGAGSQASAPPPSRPASAAEQVQQAEPAGTRVAPADVKLSGLELFLLSDGKPDDE